MRSDTLLFRRTRRRLRSRLGLDNLESLELFPEPENVDRHDWDRALHRTQRQECVLAPRTQVRMGLWPWVAPSVA